MEIKRKETKNRLFEVWVVLKILIDWGIKKSGELLSKTPFSKSHCFSTFMTLIGDRQKPEAQGVQRCRDKDDFLKI